MCNVPRRVAASGLRQRSMSPVPVQLWQGCEPGPRADVAGVNPVPPFSPGSAQSAASNPTQKALPLPGPSAATCADDATPSASTLSAARREVRVRARACLCARGGRAGGVGVRAAGDGLRDDRAHDPHCGAHQRRVDALPRRRRAACNAMRSNADRTAGRAAA